MNYELAALLNKMGVPDLAERQSIKWAYTDALDPGIHGFAEVRLEGNGKFLTAELRHHRKNYEDDLGILHPFHAENFYLQARRIDETDVFRITLLSFDGRTYDLRQSAMIELGLSLFHSRAVEISTKMVEQRFDLVRDEMKRPARQMKQAVTKPMGNVIPFRQRKINPFQKKGAKL